MVIKPKIYFVSEREVHMVGNSVGVCWNLEEAEKQLKDENEVVYKAKINIRSGRPYIDFVDIRKDGDSFYVDEDSSVVGGIDVGFAKEIVEELKLAIEYITTLK